MTILAPLPRKRAKRIVYIGTPEIAVAPLQALVAEGFVIELVVTGIDKRRGRGSQTTANPVKTAAIALGIPVSHDINDVLRLNSDGLLGVVVAFGNIISQEILQHVPMINIHYSALPRWRGAAPVERAILSGDVTTAVCIIQVAEQLDAGDVLASTPCTIQEDDSVETLRNRLGQLALPLLINICNHGVTEQIAQTGEVVVARKITAQDLAINWSSSSAQILRQIRVGNAFTFFDGKRFKIHEASKSSVNLALGTISVHDGSVLVGASEGSVQLVTVQPEGKPRVLATDWARGARLSDTSTFSDRYPAHMNQSSASSHDGRLLGHVEQFDFDRGLGMIWSSGQEYLFHCAEIVDGTRDINIGASVSFVVAHRFGHVEASEIEKIPN